MSKSVLFHWNICFNIWIHTRASKEHTQSNRHVQHKRSFFFRYIKSIKNKWAILMMIWVFFRLIAIASHNKNWFVSQSLTVTSTITLYFMFSHFNEMISFEAYSTCHIHILRERKKQSICANNFLFNLCFIIHLCVWTWMDFKSTMHFHSTKLFAIFKSFWTLAICWIVEWDEMRRRTKKY